MKEIWGKYRSIILIIMYALALIAVVVILGMPLVSKVKDTSNDIQKKIIDREIETSKIGQLPNMEKNWNNAQEKMDKIEVILDKESEVGFIENIDMIASRTENKVDLKIGDNTDVKDLKKIKSKDSKNSEKGILDEINYLSFFPIQLNVKGDYKSLINFIHLLENSHFYVNIISIDLKKQIDTLGNDSSSSSKDEEKIEKEILVTNISAIVYTKK